MKKVSSVKKFILCSVFLFLCCATDKLALAQNSNGFADVAEKILPSVVSVVTSAKDGENTDSYNSSEPKNRFDEEFTQFFNTIPEIDINKMSSMGSGFIVDAQGFILTNNHVIQGSKEILVTLYDGTSYKAKVVGSDKKTDIALIKIEPKKDVTLIPVRFTNSDKLRVGDWVIAVGNPYGLGNTVTAGIVSARARDIQSGPYDDFIQTDVSINRGNSGGPLFNYKGEVVGVNTAIFSPSGGSVGISFAIPSNMAFWVFENLKKYGKIRRGKLGIKVQSITSDIAESLGIKQTKGALVASVEIDGSAYKAGIEPGDIITKFNGVEIENMRSLPRMVAETPVGQTVPILVWSNGTEKALRIKIDEMQENELDKPVAKNNTAKDKSIEVIPVDTLGISVAKITSLMREKFRLSDKVNGLVVADVQFGSDAATKSIKPGDIIVEVNRVEVTKPEDLEKQIVKSRKEGAKSILILVDGVLGLRFVALRPNF